MLRSSRLWRLLLSLWCDVIELWLWCEAGIYLLSFSFLTEFSIICFCKPFSDPHHELKQRNDAD